MFLTRPPLRRPGRFVSPVLAGGACRAIFDIVDQTVGTGSLLAGPASPMRRPGGQGRRAYAEYDSFELRVFALDTPYHPNPSSPVRRHRADFISRWTWGASLGFDEPQGCKGPSTHASTGAGPLVAVSAPSASLRLCGEPSAEIPAGHGVDRSVSSWRAGPAARLRLAGADGPLIALAARIAGGPALRLHRHPRRPQCRQVDPAEHPGRRQGLHRLAEGADHPHAR